MQAALTRLIDGFGESPLIKGKLMREMLESDRDAFRAAAIPLLKNVSDERGCRYLVTLLCTNDLLIQALCDNSALRLEEAVSVAKAAARVDPHLHVRLLHHLLDSLEAGNDPGEDAGAGRLLEIVSAVADRGSLLPLLTQLLRHPNARIRSKVALLIGRSNKSTKWLEKRMSEEDPRVRANAIEALWGVEGEQSRTILWEAAKDTHNRVAGNALVGLYRTGDAGSIAAILEMAGSGDVPRRTTAAWAMGEIEDPRFLLVLGRMLVDAQGSLRGTVFHSITAIKNGSLHNAARDHFQVGIIAGQTTGDFVRLRVTVSGQNGQPVTRLAPTQFVTWVEGAAVTRYSIEEHAQPEHLALGFIVPRRLETTDPYSQTCEKALLNSLRVKRASDVWCVLKYPEDADTAGSMAGVDRIFGQDISDSARGAALAEVDATFSARLPHLRALVEGTGHRRELPVNMIAAAERLLQTMTGARGSRHLFLFQEKTCRPDAAGLQNILAAALAARVAIHVISQCADGGLREICARTAGTFQHLSKLESLPVALENLYASLLFRYDLQYRSERIAGTETISPQPVRLQILTPDGQGEATVLY
ncbi:MAG: HEAT repeat domain-containing protein [Acidobacteriota bacterium]|nr:HEAT repeat domain-containing protein [Acidobacteriota bacterium]